MRDQQNQQNQPPPLVHLRNTPQPEWDIYVYLGTFWDENIHPFTYSETLSCTYQSNGLVDVIIPEEWMQILFRDGRLWLGAFADYLDY